MTKSRDSQLEYITRTIVRRYKPQKIILFGSRAYGRPQRESDYDILVIKQTRQRDLERMRKISGFFPLRVFSLDVLVRTPRELRDRLEGGFTVYKEIVAKGKVLYERPR